MPAPYHTITFHMRHSRCLRCEIAILILIRLVNGTRLAKTCMICVKLVYEYVIKQSVSVMTVILFTSFSMCEIHVATTLLLVSVRSY